MSKQYTYLEPIKIIDGVDIVPYIIQHLDKWNLSSMPVYVGNNFEVYASKNKQIEIVVNHYTREIITAYKA